MSKSLRMRVESALFFESPVEMYRRIFLRVRPHSALPEVEVSFKRYANANSRIKLAQGRLVVEISDLLESAPTPVQEALAHILISKLYRQIPDAREETVYRRYLNRSDVRRVLEAVKQERGRKQVRSPKGSQYDLSEIFEILNFEHFHGLMARPNLGWSLRSAHATLGHYDASHNMIVLSSLLDSPEAPELAVRYVMFHEMLHVKYPTNYRAGRRCVHTPEFKSAERKFPQYKAARAALKKFIETTARYCTEKRKDL
jgi:predicted metal-dependent hydrolase